MPCHETQFFCLSGSVAAAAFSAPPNLTPVAGDAAFLTQGVPFELLGVTLSTTLTNFGTANMGVFVMVGVNQPLITLANTSPVVIGAITGQNSLAGPPAVPIPSDKVVTTVFLQPKRIEPNTRISLYAFGDTTAGNSLTAVASLVMRQAP